MTVEVENQEKETEVQEEEVKTSDELAKEMYPDDVKKEAEEKPAEEEVEEKPEEEAPKEEAKEGQDEQEEAKDREDPEEKPEVKLTLSKDSLLEKDDLGKLEEFAKDRGLSQESAEGVLQFAEKQKATLNASVAEWTEAIGNHKVYGGDKLEAATAIANKPLEKFGSEGMSTFLEKSGFSNHPDVFDFCYNIGKAMGDDSFVKGSPAAKPKESRAHRMYANDKPNKE